MIHILQNLALFWVNNANFFAEFFGENIFKNHNICRWLRKLPKAKVSWVVFAWLETLGDAHLKTSVT
jgi:hypothetical protein